MILPGNVGPLGPSTRNYAQSPGQVRLATQFSGSSAAAKVHACISDLPATGGTCDARGLEGAQTFDSDIFAGAAKTGSLVLGAGTYTLRATQNPPPGWSIIGTIGGTAPGGLSTAKWGTRFVLAPGVSIGFKFNDVYMSRFENFQIDCGSQPGSVGIWYTGDNLAGRATSQNDFSNFGIYNCQTAFQIGPPVTEPGNPNQMDQTNVRRFQVVSSLPGAEAFTFNAGNSAQTTIFEEGMIQAVNIGFDVKYYGGLGQWKRITFGGLKNGPPLAISGASDASPIVIATSSPHGYVTGNRVQITGVNGYRSANGTWQITVLDATHFSLNGSTGGGSYTSGGTAIRTAMDFNLTSPADYWIEECQAESGARESFHSITNATGATPIVLTVPNHGYETGDIVNIAGVRGNTAANSMWQITKIDSNTFALNGSVGNGSPLLTTCSSNGPFDYRGGSCIQRINTNFININGSPYTGGVVTLVGNKFDEPVVVTRMARITSISNFGDSIATVGAGVSARIVSVNDRFPHPGAMGGWDTSVGGQVLRLGGGDAGADNVTLTAPSFRFAGLGAPPNGTIVFCTDCNSTCTGAGGPGQICFRVNGTWTH